MKKFTKTWLEKFDKVIENEEEPPNNDAEWTKFLQKIMKKLGGKISCWPQQLGYPKDIDKGEYLTIDVMFFEDKKYDEWKCLWKKWSWDPYNNDPYIIPSAIVELENYEHPNKIAYCLWKVCCVRSPLKVLICHQKGNKEIEKLRKCLQKVIIKGDLMANADGDLIVIIGDEECPPKGAWSEYFSKFIWKNNKLTQINI